MRLMKTLAYLLVVTVPLFAKSQSQTVGDDGGLSTVKNMTNIIPPSPDAFKFSTSGNLPIGTFTGTAQFSIPVYVAKSGSLSHPISLSYSTNGIRVDEMPGRIGTGWSLSTGGVITRTVLDLPDEFSNRVFYTGTPNADAVFFDYVEQKAYATPPDYQPDEYSFNVNGLSGKFIKAENGTYQVYGAASKVQIGFSPGGGFMITNTDGVRYYFDQIEYTKNVSPIEPLAPQNIPGFTITGWHLTKIKSITNDSIVFNYSSFSSDTLTYYNGVTQELGFDIAKLHNSQPLTQGCCPLPACEDPTNCVYLRLNFDMTQSLSKYLSSIDFSNGRVEFKTSSRDDVPGEIKIDSIKILRNDNAIIKAFALSYVYAQNASNDYDTYGPSNTNLTSSYSFARKRLFLTEVHELSTALNNPLKHIFTYDDINGLPPRFSFSQDKFGFFNGKFNKYFFPNDTWINSFLESENSPYNNFIGGDRTYEFNYAKKGVLKKIQYPTGGSTTFEYEPHKLDFGPFEKQRWDTIYAALDTSTSMNQSAYSQLFTIYPGTKVAFKMGCNWASTEPWDFPDSYEGYFSIVDASTDNPIGSYPITRPPGSSLDEPGGYTTLAPGTYRLKITANKPRLKLEARLDMVQIYTDTSETSGIGGVRVKSIVDSADEVTFSNRREFYYSNWISPDAHTGTGVYYYPDGRNFVKFTRTIWDHNNVSTYSGNNILTSSSTQNIYLSDNNTICYPVVIELNDAGNGNNLGGTEYIFRTRKKSTGVPLTTVEPVYHDQFNPYPIDGCPQNNDDFVNGLLDSTKIFSYTTKFGSRTILKEVRNFYSIDTLAIDTFYAVQRELDVSSPYGDPWPWFSEYKINHYQRYDTWVKLDSTVEKNYSSGNILSNKTSYSYTNTNYKPNSETHSTSDGNPKYVFYSYPPNATYGSTDYADYYGMTQNNILDVPILVTTQKSNSIKSQRTYFDQYSVSGNTFYQPATVLSQVNSLTADTELTIQQYDAKGNILQYITRDGITNSIIWGYDGNYPVAKVQGANHSSCMAVLNSTVLNNPSSDYALRAELHNLRTQLSGTVFVSTLTYSPLVGVTSESDFNNKTTYYEYDTYNRLKIIRDQDSNIVKRICYNFKGQQTECAESHTFPATPCNSHNCSGYDRMCIEGSCVQSTTLILVSSEYVGNGFWECTYAYTFSNGTITGQEFIEYQQAPFGCLEPF